MLTYCTSPLNEHVLEEIFSIVYDTSYLTVQSLLLTNSLFNRITRPLLYRYIALNTASSDFVEEIQSWLVDPEKLGIPRAIRRICIERMYGARPKQLANDSSVRIIGSTSAVRKQRDKQEEWSTIAALISQTTQLRSVTFGCAEAMPLVLLQAIHNYPTTVHLDITQWTRTSSGMLHDDAAELELARSPYLRSLQATLYIPGQNARDLRIPAFRRIIKSAPNLQSVKMEIVYGGCVVLWDGEADIQEWRALAAGFEHNDWPRARYCGIRNLKIRGADLSDWKEKELSQVTNLECADSLPLKALSYLTSLTHLTLRMRNDSETIDDVLMACPPLTSLNVIGWAHCLQLGTIITHHGHTLRALSLHELERKGLDNVRETLSITELRHIRDGCSHLIELSIDLNIAEKLPPEPPHLSTAYHQDIYDTLATFPHLRRLQLNYNIGISTFGALSRSLGSAQSYRQMHVPFVDESLVEELWRAVNLCRTASPIQELRVAQGEAQRPTGYGYPAGWVTWEQGTHQWFKATPSERDDEPDRIRITRYRDVPDFSYDIWREYRW